MINAALQGIRPLHDHNGQLISRVANLELQCSVHLRKEKTRFTEKKEIETGLGCKQVRLRWLQCKIWLVLAHAVRHCKTHFVQFNEERDSAVFQLQTFAD